MFGKVTKTEWCLLGLTGIFLCGLLALSQHDRREMEDGGVETDLAVAQEAFMPDVRPLDLNTATAEEWGWRCLGGFWNTVRPTAPLPR